MPAFLLSLAVMLSSIVLPAASLILWFMEKRARKRLDEHTDKVNGTLAGIEQVMNDDYIELYNDFDNTYLNSLTFEQRQLVISRRIQEEQQRQMQEMQRQMYEQQQRMLEQQTAMRRMQEEQLEYQRREEERRNGYYAY